MLILHFTVLFPDIYVFAFGTVNIFEELQISSVYFFADINLLLELLISLKNYESALEIMHRHCSAQFTSQVAKEDLAKLNPGKIFISTCFFLQ